MITIKQARMWQEALLSGKYNQTQSVLQDEKGYCCLGVLCDIVIIDEDKDIYADFLAGELQNEQSNAPTWLKELNGDLKNRIGISFDVLNDEHKFTFPDIANVIEIVYIHNRRTNFKVKNINQQYE